MNPQLLELALRKQALQFRCEAQRERVQRQLGSLCAVIDRGQRLRDGLAWMRHNAPLLSAVLIGVVLIKPAASLRWLRRGLIGWQLYRRTDGLRAAFFAVRPAAPTKAASRP